MMSCADLLSPLGNRVLGHERHLRLRVARSLMAAYVYLVCMLILARGTLMGIVDPTYAWGLIIYMLCGITAFYVVLRTGVSCRRSDPGLVVEQSLFAITSIVIAYAIVGPVRGAVLMLLALVLSFGMFTLTPRQTLAIGGFAIVLLAITMAVLASTQPARFPPQLEVAQFCLAVLLSAHAKLTVKLQTA